MFSFLSILFYLLLLIIFDLFYLLEVRVKRVLGFVRIRTAIETLARTIYFTLFQRRCHVKHFLYDVCFEFSSDFLVVLFVQTRAHTYSFFGKVLDI